MYKPNLKFMEGFYKTQMMMFEESDAFVVLPGGVGTLDHLVDGIREGGASAVLAASIFHFGEYGIRQAKEAMQAAGVEVRL